MGIVRRRIRSGRDISGLNMIGDALNPATPSNPPSATARQACCRNEDEMVESREALIKADADTCLTYWSPILRQSRRTACWLYRVSRHSSEDSSGSVSVRWKIKDTRPIRRVTQFCLAVRLCPFHDNLPCDAQHNGSTMKLEPLRTEYYKRRTAAPASKSNFRKFRRKHDGRQTWAREDDSIRNSYARRDSVAVNVLSAGQCGGWLRSGRAKTWPENKPNRSNASVDRCQTQSYGIHGGREPT